MAAFTFMIKKNLPEQVRLKRAKIRQDFLNKSACVKDGRMTSLAIKDLQLLYTLYDLVFFSGQLQKARLDLTFSLSRRMTKAAGKTIYRPDRDTYEIRLGAGLFFSYQQGASSALVCGIKAQDSLEALLLVFEHELCHVVERLLFASSSCKKDRFKKLAANVFGHSSSHHELGYDKTHDQDLADFQSGSIVSFEFKGAVHEGVVSNITKRATVMVKNKDGDYRDGAGTRYSKYYVPLGRLRKKTDQA